MTITDPIGLGDTYPYKWNQTAHFDNSGSAAITEGDLCALVWSESAQSLTVKPADTDTDNQALCICVAAEDIPTTGGGLVIIQGYAEVNIGSGSVSAGERIIPTSTAGVADGSNIRQGAGVFLGDEIGTSNKAPVWLGSVARQLSDDGIVVGDSTSWYESATDTIKSDDNVVVEGDITAQVGNAGHVRSGLVNSSAGLAFGPSEDTTLERINASLAAFSDNIRVQNGQGNQCLFGTISNNKPGIEFSADGGTNIYEDVDGEIKTDDILTASRLRSLDYLYANYNDAANQIVVGFNGSVEAPMIDYGSDHDTTAGRIAANTFGTPDQFRFMSDTATTAGGALAARFGSGPAAGLAWGSGVPTLSAPQGTLYLRTDGSSTSTRAYINTDGGTTWTAITTAA